MPLPAGRGVVTPLMGTGSIKLKRKRLSFLWESLFLCTIYSPPYREGQGGGSPLLIEELVAVVLDVGFAVEVVEAHEVEVFLSCSLEFSCCVVLLF